MRVLYRICHFVLYAFLFILKAIKVRQKQNKTNSFFLLSTLCSLSRLQLKLSSIHDTIRYVILLAYWRSDNNILRGLRTRLAAKQLHHTSIIVNNLTGSG